MASDSETDEEAEAAAAKKKKRNMIIGLVVVLGAVYKFVLAPAPEEVPEEIAFAEEEQEIEEGVVVPIPELVLNLADEGELRYVRLGIAVVLEVGHTKDTFEPQMPIVSDVVVEVVSAKTLAELRAPGAKETIKAELSIKAREAFDDSTVARIIFTSFVMQ